MVDVKALLAIVKALGDHVRVNETLKTVEIYDEYGVKLVLRNLDDATYTAFAEYFVHY